MFESIHVPILVVFIALVLGGMLLALSIILAIYMMFVTVAEIVGDTVWWVKLRVDQFRHRNEPATGLELLIKNAQDRLRAR